MRITFVTPFPGLHGGIRVIAIYAERLRQRGHMVTVVSTPEEPIPLRRKVKSLVLGRGWPGLAGTQPCFFKPEGGVEVRVLEEFRPVSDDDVPAADVVVATWWLTAHWVQQLSAEKGAKAILIQGYEVEEGRPHPLLDASWRMPMHKIVISKWLVDLARDKFGDSTVSHVPNGVDLGQFHAGPRGKQRVPTVGLLYSNSWFKGCQVSLAAVRAAAAKLPNLRLICFGSQKPGLDLRLPDFAEFHLRPPQETLKDLYAQCDVWICGSRREGFHLPPLEAMACRCPVVSTRVGGPLDIIEDGLNGYLVDIGDTKALEERLLKVLQFPVDKWREMSEAAFQTAKRLSWDDATDLLEAALQTATQRRLAGSVVSV